jgi:hypothetical protein
MDPSRLAAIRNGQRCRADRKFRSTLRIVSWVLTSLGLQAHDEALYTGLVLIMFLNANGFGIAVAKRVAKRNTEPRAEPAEGLAGPVDTLEPQEGPELFFAIAGAVGTDLTQLREVLKEALKEVQYDGATVIHLSDRLRVFERNEDIPPGPDDVRIAKLMDAGDALRRDLNRSDAMALLGISAIREERKQRTGSYDKPARRRAYIIHSLKRPEEVQILQAIYGRAFHLIAAFATRDFRVSGLASRIAQSHHDFIYDKYRQTAEQLVHRDEMDLTEPFGQDMRDTFPEADFFVDAASRSAMKIGVERFIDLPLGIHLRHQSRTNLECSSRVRRL